MAVESANLASAGATTSGILVDKGQDFMFSVAGTFVGTWKLQFKAEGENGYSDVGRSYTTQEFKSGTSAVRGHYRITMSAYTSGTAEAKLYN
jgi:hypothetical protein